MVIVNRVKTRPTSASLIAGEMGICKRQASIVVKKAMDGNEKTRLLTGTAST
jgi:hypothetical protein